jgi:hypothetical protein
MPENKTRPTKTSVAGYLAGIKDETRRKDCATLAKLMTNATKQPAKMWGSGIVGFGSYHYKYASGREGDSCLTGFSSRKEAITLYLSSDFPGRAKLLPALGKHKVGGGCLHIRQLGDVDLAVLERLIASAFKARQRSHC